MSSAEDRDVSLMAVDQYMRQVRWTVPLTDEEEARLVQCVERGKAEREKRYPDAGVLDQAQRARDRLVEGYLPIVVGVARKYRYCSRGMEFLDLIQEGNLGLLEAFERTWDAERYPFRAVAITCVRDAIWAALAGHDRLVRLPQGVVEALSKLTQVERRLCLAQGRPPTMAELAAALGVSEDKVREWLLVRDREQVASLQGMLDGADAEERCTFVSLFAQEVLADERRQQELAQVLHQALESALTTFQGEVLRLRYGLCEEDGRCQTLGEIAQVLRSSVSSVSNTEREAKARLSGVLAPVEAQGRVSYQVQTTRHADYYTAQEAMALLGKPTSTFYKLVYRGCIPSERREGRKGVWFFPKAAIDALVHEGALPA